MPATAIAPATAMPSQPSSLIHAGARTGTGCPQCGSPRLTALVMTLTDGTPVDFASCHACEHRFWSQDGATLPFADVLRRATKVKL